MRARSSRPDRGTVGHLGKGLEADALLEVRRERRSGRGGSDSASARRRSLTRHADEMTGVGHFRPVT